MNNPYPNPFSGRSGLTQEILASLTPKELGEVIAHYIWNQSHGVEGLTSGTGYNSREYYEFRTNRWIYAAEVLLAQQGYTVIRNTGAIKRKVKYFQWR